MAQSREATLLSIGENTFDASWPSAPWRASAQSGSDQGRVLGSWVGKSVESCILGWRKPRLLHFPRPVISEKRASDGKNAAFYIFPWQKQRVLHSLPRRFWCDCEARVADLRFCRTPLPDRRRLDVKRAGFATRGASQGKATILIGAAGRGEGLAAMDGRTGGFRRCCRRGPAACFPRPFEQVSSRKACDFPISCPFGALRVVPGSAKSPLLAFVLRERRKFFRARWLHVR